MARPGKPYEVIKGEGVSHRTKAELAMREEGEKALTTGKAMQESPQVRADPVAHKTFMRLRGLLGIIAHNDAIHELAVNRYCLLTSETMKLAAERLELDDELAKLREAYDAERMEADSYFDRLHRLLDKKIKIDSSMDKKRAMLLTIEKEMAMTVAGALRCVPRQVKKDDKDDDPMLRLLEKRNG